MSPVYPVIWRVGRRRFTAEERKVRHRKQSRVAYAKSVGRPVRPHMFLTELTDEERKLRKKLQNKKAALKHYGLSIAEYEERCRQQGGRCALVEKTSREGLGVGRLIIVTTLTRCVVCSVIAVIGAWAFSNTTSVFFRLRLSIWRSSVA